jgi:hypothetical protein
VVTASTTTTTTIGEKQTESSSFARVALVVTVGLSNQKTRIVVEWQ